MRPVRPRAEDRSDLPQTHEARLAAAELPPVWEGARRRHLTLLVLSGLGQAAAAATIAWFTPHLLSAPSAGARWRLTAVLVLAAVAVGLLRWAEWVLAELLGQHYVLEVRRLLVSAALAPGRQANLGITVARTTNDLSALRNWVAQGIAPLASGIPLVVGVVVALLLISWPLGVAVLVTALALVGVIGLLAAPVLARSRELRRRRGRMASHIADTVAAATTVRAAGGVERELRRLDDLSDEVRRASVTRAVLAGVMRGGAASVAVLAMILAGITAAWVRLPADQLTTALLLVGLVSTPVQDMGRVAEYRQAHLAACIVLARALRRGRTEPAPEPRSGRRAHGGRGFLHVHDLPGPDPHRGAPELLAGQGARVHVTSRDPEQVDALVARLVGDEPGTDGWVQLDGWDLDTVPGRRRRRLLGYVSADAPLEQGRLSRAVRYRRPDSDEPVSEVLERVGLTQAVTALPRGERTMLRRGGEPLTREQRVLLHLARGLYGDPPLLVLHDVHDQLSPTGQEALARALETYRGVVLATGDRTPPGWRTWTLDGSTPLRLVPAPTTPRSPEESP
ncbi:ABC-type multidrug transport system, ATPase and permease component [Kytococcus aerolatus]|uniref:ABC-type multidrug transport system, ATPase and permease component n=1 Tax=Kytococcus aerolatus TaxID=592308 RepID=A0A212TAJ4_9MICO|nr:ABC-type multidrug transport system, ATPase and permease component [Kytococcus aerolatus]